MKQYIQENKERFFEELFSLLRIPSISAKKEHKEDILALDIMKTHPVTFCINKGAVCRHHSRLIQG